MANNGQNRRAQDSAMASRLKAEKTERISSRCPLCYKVVSLATMYVHIAYHKDLRAGT